MRASRLFKRSLVLILALLSVVTVSITAFSGWHLYTHLTAEYKSKGKAVAQTIADTNIRTLVGRDVWTLHAAIDRYQEMEGISYVYVVNASGEIVTHTFAFGVPDELTHLKVSSRGTSVNELSVQGKGEVIDIAAPIRRGVAGYVHVGMDKRMIRGYITSAIASEVGLAVVILLISAVVVYIFFDRNINKPLNYLADYALKIVSHDYSDPVEIRSGDEFEALAGALQFVSTDMQGFFARLDEAAWEMARKDAELEDALTRMNAIVDNIADGLLVTDMSGTIIRANAALFDMFFRRPDELSDKNAKDLFSPELYDLIEKGRNSEQGEVVRAEVELPGKRTGMALAAPLYQAETHEGGDEESGREGRCVGVVTIIRDVTREKEVDRMKTDFISTVSHELRTPLTSILGFARIIARKLDEDIFPHLKTGNNNSEKTTDRIRGNLDIIVSEGERLTSLINNLLDIAKMEAGKIDWKRDQLMVSDLAARAASAVEAIFQQKGIGLKLDIAAELPQVMGDRDRLIQVIINLLSNALKFTEAGHVTVQARLVPSSAGSVQGCRGPILNVPDCPDSGDVIEIRVIDTGIGIAAEEQEQIFEKFKQVGDTLTSKPGGTGLGLPICKQIVEHHGGLIWAESRIGKGSSFVFTLPVRPKDAGHEKFDITCLTQRLKESVNASCLAGVKTVLVVDDDAPIRSFLRQELEAAGYNVRDAVNGVDAVRRAKEDPPDLIVLDVMMPEMNGFDAAAVLKNDPLTMRVPIIILSIVEDRERGYRVGIDRYLRKPVDVDELLREIGELISQGASKRKVMVVDEDAAAVNTLSEVLEAKGYTVVGACNGTECIDKAVSAKPDMIIIDAVFSDKHNIIKTLRFEKGLENVYFVFMKGDATNGKHTS